MELYVERESAPSSTPGKIYVDGNFECFTLEDPIHEVKVPGETCIPAGRYEVSLTFSPHFQRILPLINDVPQFTGVRIHPGNTPRDTEGCILVGGFRLGPSKIGGSRVAFDRLFEKLQASSSKIFITVENPQKD